MLLTGATGFIGRRLLSLLQSRGFDIRLLVRSQVSNYETVLCDLGKDKIPKNTFKSVETIFHLANYSKIITSNKSEDLYRLVNLEATVELARLAAENGVERFVFVSSVKAGDILNSKNFIIESAYHRFHMLYAKNKRETELRLLEIGKKFGMNISIIRPSLVYGSDVKGNLRLMLTGIKKGWFPPLPEIGNRLSMIHVDDLVKAILLVAYDNRSNGKIYIATDGRAYSSRKIYNILCENLGKSIPKWSVPKILLSIASLLSPKIKYQINTLLSDAYYSSEKLEKLGFKAQFSLREMNETCF